MAIAGGCDPQEKGIKKAMAKLVIDITLRTLLEGLECELSELLDAMAEDSLEVFGEDPGRQIATILRDASAQIEAFASHDAEQPIQLLEDPE